jgi:D-alanyl-D-alanine carboxypeptidase/D-alanyl-D-alanine-endopeptidase (penicillin-binding protein 4)
VLSPLDVRKVSSPQGARLALCLTVATALAWTAWPSGSSADPKPPGAPRAAAPPLDTEGARQAVERLAKDLEGIGATLGASVVNIREGTEIAARDAERPMNPASNAKIATAVTAMSALGGEHRFSTGLYGELKDGRVDELVLRGRGDPTLTIADLRGLAEQLARAGATEVGKIVVDQSHFDGPFTPPAFEQQPDEWAPFRAPTAAVSIERNTVTLLIRPASAAGGAATISVDPPGFVEISGKVETGGESTAERLVVELEARGDRLGAKVRGSLPLGSRPVPVTRRVDDPSLLAGYALRAVLVERGLAGAMGVSSGKTQSKRALALHTSAPLAEILPRLGKDSDNFTAEMLFLAIGAELEKTASAAAGARAVEKTLAAKTALSPGSYVKNGSGLFDANRLSARDLTTLLSTAATDPRMAPEIVSHLAIAGVDGTLRSRMTSWKQQRAIRAKTGTLADVVALSGYVLDEQGAPALAFSFLVSGARGKTAKAREAIDRAASRLGSSVWTN